MAPIGSDGKFVTIKGHHNSQTKDVAAELIGKSDPEKVKRARVALDLLDPDTNTVESEVPNEQQY